MYLMPVTHVELDLLSRDLARRSATRLSMLDCSPHIKPPLSHPAYPSVKSDCLVAKKKRETENKSGYP